MMLVIGLGNPGNTYERTRHNIGREIAAACAQAHNFGAFRFEKKWNSQIEEGKIGKTKAVIALPDTMMNKSGGAVAPVARFYKIKPKNIFVIHDDADIPLGRAKLSHGKRSAGHKGVESVIRALKTKDFWRFRIGIAGKRDIPAEKLVLKKFTPDERAIVKRIVKKTLEAVLAIAGEGPERAMNAYHQ